jgi:hypothetical protein
LSGVEVVLVFVSFEGDLLVFFSLYGFFEGDSYSSGAEARLFALGVPILIQDEDAFSTTMGTAATLQEAGGGVSSLPFWRQGWVSGRGFVGKKKGRFQVRVI